MSSGRSSSSGGSSNSSSKRASRSRSSTTSNIILVCISYFCPMSSECFANMKSVASMHGSSYGCTGDLSPAHR